MNPFIASTRGASDVDASAKGVHGTRSCTVACSASGSMMPLTWLRSWD